MGGVPRITPRTAKALENFAKRRYAAQEHNSAVGRRRAGRLDVTRQ